MNCGSVFRRFQNCAGAVLVALAVSGSFDAADARSRQAIRDAEIEQSSLAGPPIMAIVSLRDQRISIYDSNGSALRARVSTGQTGYETPVGVYSVLEKEEEHYSNVYDDASMPFMQRITWSGVALHAGALPGYPASHGCVRLPYDFAERLFPMTRVGMRVIVAKDDVAPAAISHPLLLKPIPAPDVAPRAIPANYEDDGVSQDDRGVFQPDVSRWPARQAQMEELRAAAAEKTSAAEAAREAADALRPAIRDKSIELSKATKVLRRGEFAKRAADEKVARANALLSAAKTQAALTNAMLAKDKAEAEAKDIETKLAEAGARVKDAEAALAKAKEAWGVADAARAAAVAAAEDAKRKTYPVSVFISLKTQKLYVRQGHQPVFDAPVTIADPEKPIGTHIFTAVDYLDQGKDLRWTVVSISRKASAEVAALSDKRWRSGDLSSDAPATDVASASAALDRVTIPTEVASRISGYVWPGSSMIISDEEASKETGKSTDFVVLISGEPQGGIKKRPRQPAPFYFRDDPYDPYYSYGRRRYPYGAGKPFFSWW